MKHIIAVELSASEMTYIVSSGALNSTHSLAVELHTYRTNKTSVLRRSCRPNKELLNISTFKTDFVFRVL